jgi:hypothetical protein
MIYPAVAQFSYDFGEDLGELKVQVVAKFTPGRPAPPCSNPNSPLFSDSGDPAEIEIEEVTLVETGGYLAEMHWKDVEQFENDAIEALEQAYEVPW